jgi:hypothetical protein
MVALFLIPARSDPLLSIKSAALFFKSHQLSFVSFQLRSLAPVPYSLFPVPCSMSPGPCPPLFGFVLFPHPKGPDSAIGGGRRRSQLPKKLGRNGRKFLIKLLLNPVASFFPFSANLTGLKQLNLSGFALPCMPRAPIGNIVADMNQASLPIHENRNWGPDELSTTYGYFRNRGWRHR